MQKILAFAGSTRKQSHNRKLLEIAIQGARDAGATVTLIELEDFALPLLNEDLEAREGLPDNARKLKAIMREHDALMIASPEYNSAYSPLLKNTIDWLSRAESPEEPALSAYRGKVAAIMSASPGGLGGLRGLVALRTLLGNIGVLVLPEQQTVPSAFKAFNEDGTLSDERKQLAVRDLGAQLVRATRALNSTPADT